MGCKRRRCLGLKTLTPLRTDASKSANLKLLETSQPVQTCTGIALSFYLFTTIIQKWYNSVGTATRYGLNDPRIESR